MKKISAIILLFLSMPLIAQVCNDAIPRVAFDARFDVDLADPNLVTDNSTGLKWQRCVLGFVLDDNNGDLDYRFHSCEQPPENTDDDEATAVAVSFTWLEALNAVEREGDGWRIPNIKELSSIIEIACYTPSINVLVFPNTPATSFWTNTPSSFGDNDEVWSINFSDGQDDLISKLNRLPIRLVRD